ncbi:hypothetical protein PLICRDRAFT_34501 [Plicaturopsis crispa FD-325 SS-3]|nr:hypothetical protein PLICRDRAFT_34501 [Plicaturopsis crispa FD-325 SS-3]
MTTDGSSLLRIMIDDYTDVELLYAQRICHLIPAAAAFYDHMITIDQEVEFIWQQRWSVSKVLFILNRYLAEVILTANIIVFVPTNVSHTVCYRFVASQGFINVALVGVMQIILQLRIYAMHEQSKLVALIMFICFLAEIICLFVVLVLTLVNGERGVMEEHHRVSVCTMTNTVHYLRYFWPPVISFEVVLVALALWAGVRHCAIASSISSVPFPAMA